MDWTFPLFGFQISAIEAIAAFLGLIYIVFEYRANAWMWLFSITMSVLYVWVYFSQTMYANMVLTLYNIAVSVYGVWLWIKQKDESSAEGIRQFPKRKLPWLGLLIIVLTIGLTQILILLGESEVPLLDGLTASLSAVGIWMLAKKYYQQWVCWILADVLYVAMFISSGMWPSTILYIVYIIVAVFGFIRWRKRFQDSTGI